MLSRVGRVGVFFCLVGAIVGGAYSGEEGGGSEMAGLLAVSGWREGERANCLLVGPGATDAAIAAGRLKGIRAYVLSDKAGLAAARAKVDKEGLYGISVVVREGTPNDTTFPDYFFHRVLILGGKNIEESKNELWRVTRPGGKILLGKEVVGVKFEDATAPRKELNVGAAKWAEVTRPVLGAEWPMVGGYCYKDTAWVARASPDRVIRLPLRQLWWTKLDDKIENLLVGDGTVNGMLDAYTGEQLKERWPDGAVAILKDTVFCYYSNKLVAWNCRTRTEKWSYEFDKVGVNKNTPKKFIISEGKLCCLLGAKGEKVVFLDAATGNVTESVLKGLGEKHPCSRTNPGWEAIAPDDVVWSHYDHNGKFTVCKPGDKDACEWFNLKGPYNVHGCSGVVWGNGYLFMRLGMSGIGGFDTSKPGEEAKRQGWYHVLGGWNCNGPAVAYGNLYVHDRACPQNIICFAPSSPGSEEAAAQNMKPERGKEPPPHLLGRYDPEDWPMFHHDFERSGYSPDKKIAAQLEVVWKAKTNGEVRSSPAVVGERVYVGSCDHKLYALDAKTGKEIWSYITGDEIHSSPCVVDGMVYFGSDDGYIYCIEAATGELVWRTGLDPNPTEGPSIAGRIHPGSFLDFRHPRGAGPTGQVRGAMCVEGKPKVGAHAVRGSPLAVDGRIFVGTGLGVHSWGHLHCLDARSGEIIWSNDTRPSGQMFYGSSVDHAPAYAFGRIYALGDTIVVFDAATGTAVRGQGGSPPGEEYHAYYSQLALSRDRAFTIAALGREAVTVCVSLIDHSIIGIGGGWGRDGYSLGRYPAPCPVIAEGLVYCVEQGEVIKQGGGCVIRIYQAERDYKDEPERREGDVKFLGNAWYPYTLTALKCLKSLQLEWRSGGDGGITASPAYANGILFCPTREGSLVVFDAQGQRLRIQVGNGILYSSPAIARGRLYIGCDDGNIYCLEPKK